jgi:hypothetical protein
MAERRTRARRCASSSVAVLVGCVIRRCLAAYDACSTPRAMIAGDGGDSQL